LQDVQADSPVIVDVGMEYFGDKLDLWRFGGIIFTELQSQLKEASLPNGVLGPLNIGGPGVDAVLIWRGIDASI